MIKSHDTKTNNIGRHKKADGDRAFSLIVYFGLAIFVCTTVISIFDIGEVSQLKKAFFLSLVYFAPIYFVLFLILYVGVFNLSSAEILYRAFLSAIIFGFFSPPTLVLANKYIGHSERVTLSGMVMEKGFGIGNMPPNILLKVINKNHRLTVSESIWLKTEKGKQISIELKKGSLGLYYK